MLMPRDARPDARLRFYAAMTADSGSERTVLGMASLSRYLPIEMCPRQPPHQALRFGS